MTRLEINVASAIALGTLITMVFGLDARYAKDSDVTKLALAVETGHDLAELNAKIYTVNLNIADLTGRSLMYQMKAEAETITTQERVRWGAVRDELAAKQAESLRLQQELSQLD